MESRAQIDWAIENLSDAEIVELAMFTLKKSEVKPSEILNTYAAIKVKYIAERTRLKEARDERAKAEERKMNRIENESLGRLLGRHR